MSPAQSLIAELEDAIQSGSKDRRVDTLRRITDLFVAEADRLNDKQIEVFDELLGHLIKRIESKALAELSRRIGPINQAPLEVVRRLARDDNIVVAEPVLTQSPRLTDNDLIEIVNTKTQAHLLAISARPKIGEAVTDVLLQRGDSDVYHKLVDNSGANFSEGGFAKLVKHSERDETLAEKVGLRLDIPLRLFRELLLRATEAVRSRLLALAGPERSEQITQVLAGISAIEDHEVTARNQHDYSQAQAKVLAMRNAGQLDEPAIFEFLSTGQFPEVVAAISLLSMAPMKLVESLFQSEHSEAILVPCRAIGLDWSTVRMVLSSRFGGRAVSDRELDTARDDYFKLSRSNAQRVLRFWLVRHTAAENAGAGEAAGAAVYTLPPRTTAEA
jgi:uncharacterized protein (DUF2336 family)